MAIAPTYSNGLDTSKVYPALNRLGWIGQPTSPVSGRYYEDFHALVNAANVTATMPSGETIDAYRARLSRGAIMRCLSAVFREKEYLEQNQYLLRTDGSLPRFISNTAQFVGFKITVPSRGDLSVQLDSLILHFNAVATFNIYLFAENNAAPVWEKEVTTVANEQSIVAVDNLVLNQFSSASRTFYLGYFQADLSAAEAVAYASDYARTNCLAVESFTAPASGLAFDTASIQYPSDSMGLNFQYSAFRDHTARVVNKSSLFDEVIGLTVAYSIIEQILYNTRSNFTERKTKEELDQVGISLDLKGYAPISESPSVRGLAQRIDEEVKRLRLSFFPRPKTQVVDLC